MSSILKDFYTNKHAGAVSTGISMVAGRKINLPPATCQQLKISTPNATSRVDLIVHPDEPKLLIIQAEDGNYRLSGTDEHPEIYCAPICTEILARLKIEVVKAGTIHFPLISFHTDEETGIVFAIVDLTRMTANDGVYTSLK